MSIDKHETAIERRETAIEQRRLMPFLQGYIIPFIRCFNQFKSHIEGVQNESGK